MMTKVAERLFAVHSVIAQAAARAGRDASDVMLVAVSKSHPPETLQEALEAGQLLFGESRVQEAKTKLSLLPGRVRWHFIGHLQRNKLRQALPMFELFHGIDSLPLAQDFDRLAAELGTFPRGLLEVNVAGEASKFGFPPERLREQMEELLTLNRLGVEGLMCVPPPGPHAEDSRKYFVALRELRDRLAAEFKIPLSRLSMGMSRDYGIAVEEGATLIRVGSAIFGARTGKTWKPADASVPTD